MTPGALSSFYELCQRERRHDVCWGRYRPRPPPHHHVHELFPAARRLTDERAWRIRLVPEEHYVVMTTTTGRVCTADMTTGERLWEVDVLHRYPHLECDQGWMVFDDGEPDELDAVSYTHLTLPTKRIV